MELWELTHSASGSVSWHNHFEAIWANLKKIQEMRGHMCIHTAGPLAVQEKRTALGSNYIPINFLRGKWKKKIPESSEK